MAQGQFRTLINLVVVFGLLGTFLWGGSHLLNALTGSDQAARAAPTPQSVVEQPGAFGTATATPRGGTHAPTPIPSPTVVPPTDTPAPTPTPKAPPKVIASLSILGTNPSKTFSLGGGTQQIYCLVRKSALPPGQPFVLLTWTKDQPPPYFQHAAVDLTEQYSGAFINAISAGKYRCDAAINGQPFASTEFTVTP